VCTLSLSVSDARVLSILSCARGQMSGPSSGPVPMSTDLDSPGTRSDTPVWPFEQKSRTLSQTPLLVSRAGIDLEKAAAVSTFKERMRDRSNQSSGGGADSGPVVYRSFDRWQKWFMGPTVEAVTPYLGHLTDLAKIAAEYSVDLPDNIPCPRLGKFRMLAEMPISKVTVVNIDIRQHKELEWEDSCETLNFAPNQWKLNASNDEEDRAVLRLGGWIWCEHTARRCERYFVMPVLSHPSLPAVEYNTEAKFSSFGNLQVRPWGEPSTLYGSEEAVFESDRVVMDVLHRRAVHEWKMIRRGRLLGWA
jgi:hypothetical protein